MLDKNAETRERAKGRRIFFVSIQRDSSFFVSREANRFEEKGRGGGRKRRLWLNERDRNRVSKSPRKESERQRALCKGEGNSLTRWRSGRIIK